MKVLLFEWFTGGGLWLEEPPLDSLGNMLQQGSAMVAAVGLDLAHFTTIQLMVDNRLLETLDTVGPNVPQVKATLARLTQVAEVHSIDSERALKSKLRSLARDADAILLIAPETHGCLANAIGWLGDDRHKLISPSLDFVLATSNKNKLADRLNEQGFNSIPPGMPLDSFLKLSATQQIDWLPTVVKPADGAGSEGIELFNSLETFQTWSAQLPTNQHSNFRAEQFLDGIPASIAAVCRPGTEPVFFPALKQILHPPPVGEYLSSEDSLSPSQQLRAKQLATRALKCLPETTGFLGFDIVLSAPGDSKEDTLIEINPRITMSYLQLSQKLDRGLIAKLILS